MELSLIHKRLEELPSLKASLAEEAETLKYEYEKISSGLKYTHAKKSLRFKVMFPDDTVSAIKARLDSDEELSGLESEVMKAEAMWRHKMVMMQSMDDQFTAVKVIARIKIAEIGGRISFD